MSSRLSRVRTPLSLWSLRNRLILAAVVLTALAISASDFAANTALRSYLISQMDQELLSISGGSLTRLDRAGIEEENQFDDNSPFREFRPLRGVPTSASVTLLDVDGNLIGRVGGDLSKEQIAVVGMTISEIQEKGNKPFTIKGNKGQPDVRVVAQVLPTGLGSVIVANSLAEVDRTLNRLGFFFLILGLLALLAIALVSRWIIAISLNH